MFQYVIRNCFRNLRRTVLTVAGFSVSIALLGVLSAVYVAMFVQKGPPAQALRFIVRNKVSFTVPLPEAHGSAISRIPGVRAVAPLDWFGGIYKDENNPANFFAQYGTDPEQLLAARPELQLSSDARSAFVGQRTACIMGSPLAARLGLKSGDGVVLHNGPVVLELKLVGIYDAPVDNENLYFNREYVEQSLPAIDRGLVGVFLVAVRSQDDAATVPRLTDEAFRNSAAQTRTESERAFLLSFVSFVGDMETFLAVVCASVGLLMLLVAANSVLLSTRERTSETGILQALGFSRSSIVSLIVGESVVQAILGSILGCALAALLCYGIRQGPFLPPQLKTLSVGPSLAALCTVFAAALGAAAALLPGWRASRLSVVSATRVVD